MSAQPPRRRTESLFDNRYCYDYIYPRGRSGETLRAYDSFDNDRRVVIKRPAPQDAPPMRAGQELSIRNERQALERLSGHPVLTELRGHGTFRVGGHTHDYIVMDQAEGLIVETVVLQLAEQNDYLPDLETVVIFDRLLDLLAFAHDKQVIYNDVDAKHLFWDRDNYRLKVIDWGNAVFVDEPGALTTVTRANDIYQCGELLYFILTGGNRLATEVAEGGDTFFVSFGPDAEHIPAKLQSVLTRAVHPDPKRRYSTINELRNVLAEYRVPLEKTRDEIISRVQKRVRATASQEELETLAEELNGALDMDPGFPKAKELAAEIEFHLRQITIQADLDAIRIYLESSNWPRALTLLHDLLPQAGDYNEPLIRFLIAATETLHNMGIKSPPPGFLDALDPLFKGDPAAAGQTLLRPTGGRTDTHQVTWLLAEHLASHVPVVTLLRPHLVRLRFDLQDVPQAEAVLSQLDEVETQLAGPPMPGLAGLQIVYQQAAAALSQLTETIETLSGDGPNSVRDSWAASASRAHRAAEVIVQRLGEVGNHVFSDPPHAGELLHRATMIDPTSPYFGALHDYFDEVHQAISALGGFKPKQDCTNLSTWFTDVQEFIQPYLDDLPDQQLHAAAHAIRESATHWTVIVNYLALGRRQPTIDVLYTMADTIRPFNQHIAARLGSMASRLPEVAYIERLSPNEQMANFLIEGWKAWDRGHSEQAAEAGRQAFEWAQTDGERLAADRLRRLGELLDNWLADDGPHDIKRTDKTETEALAILLAEEEQERRTFAEQMPNTALYLRAMSRGIVAYMHQSSSAGWRALYMHYVLRGMLALLDDELDEAEFWRNVASKAYEDARIHRAFQVLDRGLTGRRLVQEAEAALNNVTGPDDLDAVRQAINAPLAGELLIGTEQAVQAIGDALRDWSDGDFNAASQQLETALDHINTAIEVAGLRIESFVAWLSNLQQQAADLRQARLVIEQGATSTSETPDPAITEAHQRIVSVTMDALGSDFIHQVRQWDEMYQAVLETYTTQRLPRREKLAAFDRHFASLFITKHPAYPLFRHWQTVIENLPEDQPEDAVIDVEEPAADMIDDEAVAYLDDDRDQAPYVKPIARRESDSFWNRVIIGAVVILIAAGGYAIFRYVSRDDSPDGQQEIVPTEIIGAAPDSSPGASVTQEAVVPAPTTTGTPVQLTQTPAPSDVPTSINTQVLTDTPEPTPLPTTVVPTAAPTTAVPTPSVTEPPAETQPPSPIPAEGEVAAAPPGETSESTTTHSVLGALANVLPEDRPGPTGALTPNDDGTWSIATAGTDDTAIRIEFTPDILSALFQPGAANSLIHADAVLELVSSDPAALASGDVAFGLGAENTLGQRTIGQVQLIEENLVNLGLSQNDQFRSRTQVPQQNPQIELAIRRSDSTTLSFFIDDKLLGDSVALFAQGDPITLILFVSGKDVVVKVHAFEIDYSPRNELP
ncbi:MAG: hypothetical protein JW966_14120 [Anaerolineae bacterium]|nr:hypothetical protein [Anaerolineae bacterium]